MMGMLNFMKALWSQRKNEAGQGMVEYALLIALIAIVVIAALIILGPQIAELFTNISGELEITTTVAP